MKLWLWRRIPCSRCAKYLELKYATSFKWFIKNKKCVVWREGGNQEMRKNTGKIFIGASKVKGIWMFTILFFQFFYRFEHFQN